MNTNNPLNDQPLFQQAIAFHQTGKLAEAAKHYQTLLKSYSNNSQLLSLLGTVALQMGNISECRGFIEQSVRIDANQPFAWFYLGIAFKQLKRFQDSIACYERAIALKPDYAEAYCNLGNVQVELMQFESALKYFDQAIAINNQFPLAHFNRGNLLRDLKQFDSAIASYQLALQLKPDMTEAYCNLGVAFKETKQFSEAIDCYDKALAIKPDSEYLPGQRLFSKLLCCDWQNLAQETSEIIANIDGNKKMALPFQILTLTDNLAIQQKVANCWAQDKFPPNPALPAGVVDTEHRRIRIAYFSGDFRIHPVAFLSAQLYQSHDRQKFEVFGFSFSFTKDEMTERLAADFDQFIDIQNLPDQEVAALAGQMEIDIAVDLAGHTKDSRTGIFAMRAAPVQISYLGYLGSMGAEYMDYLFADYVLIPEADRKFYTEKLVYLPSYQVNDSRRQIADIRFSREQLGLPAQAFVFCCFNNSYKINPLMFDSWMRILQRAPNSVLFLYAENPLAEQNLRQAAASRGIPANRLIFAQSLPLPEYLARYRTADLFLDTLPYNAGATASDALWAGLPVLTCTGQAFASRMAASLLTAIELPELITASLPEYEALAIELAAHPEKMAAIKAKLAANRLTTALFDTPRFTRNIEAAYRQMHQNHKAGLAPEHIFIS